MDEISTATHGEALCSFLMTVTEGKVSNFFLVSVPARRKNENRESKSGGISCPNPVPLIRAAALRLHQCDSRCMTEPAFLTALLLKAISKGSST